MQTAFTDLVGIEFPLAGFNRTPAVVAAVSKAGGLGVLAATAYQPDELDAQLTWIETQIDGRPYGVDLLVPAKAAVGDPTDLIASLRAQIPDEHVQFVNDLLDRYAVPALVEGDARYTAERIMSVEASVVPALLDVAFSHPIAMVANALGTPPPGLVARAKSAGVAVAALVGKPEHARRQLAAGVDLLVAQGTEAGGHTGTVASTVLTPEIVSLAEGVPVLTAGGVASGQQMAAALALGASGVWCGSVWLSSIEDMTPDSVKQKLLRASSSDTTRSKARTGKPARQLRSAYHDEWEREGTPTPLTMPLQALLTMDAWNRIYAGAEDGHAGSLELESFFVGQVVGSFDRLRPTTEIVAEIVDCCRRQLAYLGELAQR